MQNFKRKKKPPLLARLFYSPPVIWLTSRLARGLCSLLYSTLKLSLAGVESLKSPKNPRLLIALWHDRLLLAPFIAKVVPEAQLGVVVSGSRDGRLLAAFATTFRNVTAISVSSKNRHGALLQMCDAVQAGRMLIITPDGPRGPKHQIKEGLHFCSQKTDSHIVAMRWKASSTWTLPTWDQMQIPKPFSKVQISFEYIDPTQIATLPHKLS